MYRWCSIFILEINQMPIKICPYECFDWLELFKSVLSLKLSFNPFITNSYWDDWMRRPEQRKERACIRPEISRTRTYGKIGVSKYDDKKKIYFTLR